MSSLVSIRATSLLKRVAFQSTANRTLSTIVSSSLSTTGQPILVRSGKKKGFHQDLEFQAQLPIRPFSSTSPSPNRALKDSKRTPGYLLGFNEADLIEINMQDDGFKCWGIAIYRTTYKSDSDWEEFLRRFLGQVRRRLEYYEGLDMWDSFRPTVIEDKSLFDGATPAQIRDAFHEWARTACETEQGVTYDRAQWAHGARYRLCILVDEDALRSVLDIPEDELDELNTTGFVVMIDGRWTPEIPEEEEGDFEYEPLYGCTRQDVGWMKVHYDRAQIVASTTMRYEADWDLEYRRPPAIGFNS